MYKLYKIMIKYFYALSTALLVAGIVKNDSSVVYVGMLFLILASSAMVGVDEDYAKDRNSEREEL